MKEIDYHIRAFISDSIQTVKLLHSEEVDDMTEDELFDRMNNSMSADNLLSIVNAYGDDKDQTIMEVLATTGAIVGYIIQYLLSRTNPDLTLEDVWDTWVQISLDLENELAEYGA